MPTELLFMPDYAADPLWDATTESMVSLDRLPIDDHIRAAIRRWAGRWEELASEQMRLDDVRNGMLAGQARPVSPQAWDAIEHEGRALCQQLRDELGEEWRVGWVSFEHDQRHVQWDPDGPVALFLPGSGRAAT